jgi:hypothetical protein
VLQVVRIYEALFAVPIFLESGSARLFKCVAVNIKVLLIFKEGAGNVSLCSQTLVTCNRHVFHCTSKLHKLSEPTGTDKHNCLLK